MEWKNVLSWQHGHGMSSDHMLGTDLICWGFLNYTAVAVRHPEHGQWNVLWPAGGGIPTSGDQLTLQQKNEERSPNDFASNGWEFIESGFPPWRKTMSITREHLPAVLDLAIHESAFHRVMIEGIVDQTEVVISIIPQDWAELDDGFIFIDPVQGQPHMRQLIYHSGNHSYMLDTESVRLTLRAMLNNMANGA